ncbi:DDE-type integrase/transposase/recombinase [Roseomonas sp. GCM10028921]
MPEVRHRVSRYLNNRVENSHRPTRRRECQMQRLKSPQQARRFLSAHAMILDHLRPRRASDDRRPAPSRSRQGLPGVARGNLCPKCGVNSPVPCPANKLSPMSTSRGCRREVTAPLGAH